MKVKTLTSSPSPVKPKTSMQCFSVRGGNELELQDDHKQSMPDEQITFGAYLDRRTDAQTKGHSCTRDFKPN